MAADKQKKIAIAELKKAKEREACEYKAESERLGKILSSVGLHTQNMSPKMVMFLKTLNECAMELNTLVPNQACMTAALSEFSLSYDRKLLDIADRENLLEDLSDYIAEAQKLKEKLLLKFNELEASLPEEWRNAEFRKKRAKLYKKKKAEYLQTIHKLSQDINTAGFCHEISHENLEKRGSEIQDLLEKLKPLRLHLNSYQNLPTDLTKARLKLHEATHQLSETEENLNDTIMALNR
uniref:Uncharacterized protein n=1 Tax=Ciona savignyi TaxID=51511 RepID=H2ZCW1_CIOSA